MIRLKKQIRMLSSRLLLPILVILLLLTATAYGQNFQRAKVQVDFSPLASKAAEVIEVNVEARTLKLAAKFLKDSNPDEAAVKALLNGLQGVYVRVYQFDKDSDYSTNDLVPIHTQLHSPGWERIVGVASKRDRMNIEVYTMYEGEQMLGLTVIAAEPRELVFVNILGPIDIDKLAQLSDRLGLPDLELKLPGAKKGARK